ncbi:NAD-dependent epimerase/dehydratase family protein [Pseudonocardia xinjiangensis]|uniref:NAD-dependent epimerase/dehydratase family protein n=1 Tax=Pseudonocardia xinjiangensis TaxID=75289 RepID=A0ABX1RCT3_9PSEU|nr:NAD-dependent epimerase/dehydratase family protein [Pseudonocardia xinjiangensis]NMH78192.1 NAD-dependent epimerase/dehydratase family protein [Pseudonocardia xinjiangensis]
MKIVVTGGAGFVGANLCRLLARQADVEVVVVDDLSSGRLEHLHGVPVDVRVASILHRDALRRACDGASSIVHLAAAVPDADGAVWHCHDVNVTGTLAVLDVARDVDAQVVLASSSSVYGYNPTRPRSEDLLCLPATPFAAGKLAAESYAFAYRSWYGLRCTAFRFSTTYGPWQYPDRARPAVVPALVAAALRGDPLVVHGDGEQRRELTFVESAVEVLARSALQRSSDGAVNLAVGAPTTINELITVLSDLLGRRLAVEHRAARAGEVRHCESSAARVQRLFPGVRRLPIEEGLVRTIVWMESQAGVSGASRRTPSRPSSPSAPCGRRP